MTPSNPPDALMPDLVILTPTEMVARWMISHGYSTGHGDTVDDLLSELVGQISTPPPAPVSEGEAVEEIEELDACIFFAEQVAYIPPKMCQEDKGDGIAEAFKKQYPNGMKIIPDKKP